MKLLSSGDSEHVKSVQGGYEYILAIVMSAVAISGGSLSKSISITTSATWMCNFIIGLVTPGMLRTLGFGTYIFFAAWCLVALLFVFFVVPETKGKSLEEMDEVFGDNAAHEEKMHLVRIAAELQGSQAAVTEKA